MRVKDNIPNIKYLLHEVIKYVDGFKNFVMQEKPVAV